MIVNINNGSNIILVNSNSYTSRIKNLFLQYHNLLCFSYSPKTFYSIYLNYSSVFLFMFCSYAFWKKPDNGAFDRF